MTRAHATDAAVGLAVGVALAGAIAVRFGDDPMPLAFAGLAAIAACVPLLRDRPAAFAVACLAIVVAVAVGANVRSAIVAASFAAALAGVASIGRRSDAAICAVVLLAFAWLTWPLWAARAIVAYDVQPLVDRLVRFGPPFAINGAIDPRDAFTHRPWSYERMTLGQDVPYALPTTIWPCVALHAAIGVVGTLGTLGMLVWRKGRSRFRGTGVPPV